MDDHRLHSGQLDVTVSADGAELMSLQHARFGEMLWQAEPIWPQHAPNLFPIVGQLTGDELHAAGRSYPLKRHGFARHRRFEWLERGSGSCRLGLHDDAQTRTAFPFAFALEIAYAVEAATLNVTFTVRNPGTDVLPVSVGAHPAFRWPLVADVPKTAHTLEFEQPEPAPIRRLQDGLLKLERFASPVAGRSLRLDEQLFAADAIVMDVLASRSVRYSAPGTPAIVVAWTGFRDLGIWSKANAAFVCIEPWYGYASPVGFDGPFETKPGLMLIAPEHEERLTMSVSVEPPDARVPSGVAAQAHPRPA